MTGPSAIQNDPMRHIQQLDYRLNGASGTVSGGAQVIGQQGPGAATPAEDISHVYGRDKIKMSEEAQQINTGTAQDQGMYTPAVKALMDNMKHDVHAGMDNPQKEQSALFFSQLTGSQEKKPCRTEEPPPKKPRADADKAPGFRDMVMNMLATTIAGLKSGEEEPRSSGDESSLPEPFHSGPQQSAQSFDTDWARSRILALHRD